MRIRRHDGSEVGGGQSVDCLQASSNIGHVRKRRVYWVSWRMEEMSEDQQLVPRSSRVADWESWAVWRMWGSRVAWQRRPADWPRGIRRMAAEMRLEMEAWR